MYRMSVSVALLVAVAACSGQQEPGTEPTPAAETPDPSESNPVSIIRPAAAVERK